MDNTRRFERQRYQMPFKFTADDFPPIASRQEAMPHNSEGKIKFKEHEGMTVNSSLEGFCFMTTEPLLLGTEIRTHNIKMSNTLHKECKARVKWCHEKDAKDDFRFAVGVKRVITDDLPAMNFRTKGFASLKVF